MVDQIVLLPIFALEPALTQLQFLQSTLRSCFNHQSTGSACTRSGSSIQHGQLLFRSISYPLGCSMAQMEGLSSDASTTESKVYSSDLESGSSEGEHAEGAMGICGHTHYSHRAPWLRAMVLGANDGLVSIASLMLGVGAVEHSVRTMVVSGLAGLVAGACSMAIGEFVSVYSQRDAEKADVEKERQEHAKGPEACARELEELTQIYVSRGLTYELAKKVAEELSRVDPVRAHARDELGIDMDDYSNPMQAAVASAVAFASGGSIPLLSGSFVADLKYRLVSVIISTSFALALFGAVGARLGGAPMTKAAVRVLVGGALAMLLTFAILRLFGAAGVSV